MSAAFSAIMMVGALVLPLTSVGMIEASITLRRRTPRNLRLVSTTAIGSLSGPILQVPTGWYCVSARLRMSSSIAAVSLRSIG
jgi:hypothetical protein